ncbi:3-deoxy-7-phosphoheptulonate synthase [Candidatus Woesearchaeota archaeon]|nr:3-deoxy-7-phosphoheptulonate synthase [Candidatus Woesearchaeota archaeon]
MIIVLKPNTKKEEIEHVIEEVKNKGFKPVPFEGDERTVIHALGAVRDDSPDSFRSIRCVEDVVRILKPYKLASKEHHSQKTIVRVGDVAIGNNDFVVIAGPDSVETEKQIIESAKIMKKNGIKIMRGSAFKPRTSPYDFQGFGIEGLKLLKKARDKTGILVETEVMDVRDVPIAAQYADILRVGARNMQNFDLLKELGKVDCPVILKRGMSATIKEFIMAAEYIMASGNKNVILCERGIRTFETAYRNTLDLEAVVVLREETHLPIIVDPSHATGNREWVIPLCKAAAAAGADGILVEVHPDPEKALCDGAQSLYPEQLTRLLKELKPICAAVGKKL